jgi:hypothetical protein
VNLKDRKRNDLPTNEEGTAVAIASRRRIPTVFTQIYQTKCVFGGVIFEMK